MPRSQGSHASEIPTYEEATEPVDTHPVEISVQAKSAGGRSGPNTPGTSNSSRQNTFEHGAPEIIGDPADTPHTETFVSAEDQTRSSRLGWLVGKRSGWFRYMKTKEFWIVLLLGCVELCRLQANFAD